MISETCELFFNATLLVAGVVVFIVISINGGYVFGAVCLSVFKQDCLKPTEPISMKSGGRVERGPKKGSSKS